MEQNERDIAKISISDDGGHAFDIMQEVSNTGFGDMLHDNERNVKYFDAIRRTIDKMHSDGKKVHVLDIGTGTGLLSMMCVVSGADSVVACEAFLPMANCAEEIIKANGMIDKIKLVKKRSTELKVGPEDDMLHKANLLVAELLDTELIGEGAISIYNHAHSELLTEDVICIPRLAKCFAQVVHSTLAAQLNSFKSLANLDGEILLYPPKKVLACNVNNIVQYVQLSQFPRSSFRPLSNALKIFEFDFMNKKPIEASRTNHLSVESLEAGSTDMVFFWWDIHFDLDSDILLSCAPYWEHPYLKTLTFENKLDENLWSLIPWRDHWMQAIYYIPKPLNISSKGNSFNLYCNHDEFSFWFNVAPDMESKILPIEKHFCTCSFHQAFPRSRIGQINQSLRNKIYISYLEQEIEKNSKVLVLSDASVLGLAIRQLGAESVIMLEPHQQSQCFMQSLIEDNKIENIKFIENIEQLNPQDLSDLTHIFGEPYFINSILPWENFHFGNLLSKLMPMLPPNIKICPFKAKIMCLPVEFVDLQKMNQSVGKCEGFDVSIFDEMVLQAREKTQKSVEAFPLWEYPCRALAKPKVILQCKFRQFLKDSSTFGEIPIEVNGTCNGVALWIIYNLDEDISVNAGVKTKVEPGNFVQWDMFQQQGVHLMGIGTKVQKDHHALQYEVNFDSHKNKLSFNFLVALQDL